MPRKKASSDQANLLEARTSTAPCVPAIRVAVAAWRERDYPGVTPTTRLLLNHWFKTDHRLPGGRKFAYHPSQRAAVETLVYLYEVAGTRRQAALLEKFCTRTDLRLLQRDDFARYCVKMATGSGKTKVMALAVAWQYFNAVAEARDDCARASLLIAPNVIVFERLCHDFAGGRIFRVDPVIPPELEIYWDFQVYVRGEAERARSAGALYLTNIQQLYERAEAGPAEPDALAAVLGPAPPTKKQESDDFAPRLVARGGPLLVVNDEAHHTHDEDSEWNAVIRRLHEAAPGGLCAQFDFTATPRHTKGALFTWTVYDYPLKQAIIDNIVKMPIKGVMSGVAEGRSAIASTRYQAYLTAAVERWKEYRDELAPLAKKPVLFVMMHDTAEADEVGDWLQTKYPAEFGGDRLLVIHTNKSGEISKGDLEKARVAAREVDEAHSPINCIVSVLMLREGWDVQNVTVIVGLRPFSAKSNILSEQAIGRGLRLMFRAQGAGYRERVDVIGNKAFIEFVEELEREENIELEKFQVGKDKLCIVKIAPDPDKLAYDIVVPQLSPILARKSSLAEEIAALDVQGWHCPILPRQAGDAAEQAFRYEGYDFLTLQKLVERDYTIPEAQTAEEVIGYYARRIAAAVKLPSQFAALAPKVREFLATKAFGKPVELDAPGMIQAISHNTVAYLTEREFTAALRQVVVEVREPELLSAGRKLSETPLFPWSRPTLEARKTVFNLTPCDNDFERQFARFLDHAPDVAAFAKLPEQFAFAIQYTDSTGNLRHYEPDFVAVSGGVHTLLETKGREDLDVRHKDRAARLWCDNATQLTGTPWQYLKVPQTGFNQLQPDCLADLLVFAS